MISLLAAGRLLGLSRSTIYRLAKAGAFPCRVLRIGGRYAVPVRGLRALLDHTNLDHINEDGINEDGPNSRPTPEKG
ncbi:Helix-turn-helix domain-containing protein [Nonomuraea solani]|uniref:Helix-turn-helix domain-containing protein n=1 Tax=Nonomuraea solani TaxID=1144553 RepID=A0A1H6F0F4_9ACTN|nr:Helix-turn-helix domain-containing protein [Nonomuraea solani]